MNCFLPQFAILLIASSASGAFAQGADDCAQATAITGPGPHLFNNTAATDSAATPSCGYITRDVWFAWTATATGVHIFQTCGQAANDTMAAIYGGSCNGPELGCNNDACGLQTRATFDALAGQTYIIQLGSYAANTGAGAFTITLDAPVFNPTNGSFYRLVEGVFDWQAAHVAAQASSWQGTPGHLATITTQAELDFIRLNFALGISTWIGLFQNTGAPGYSEPANGWEWVTGEPLAFTNWYPGEPNDLIGAENHAEIYANGQWNDAPINHVYTRKYLIEYSNFGIGVNYCTANANSTGQTGVISGAGSASVTANNLTVESTRLPHGSFGVFLTSLTQANTSNPGGSQGILCLGGAIGRYTGPGQIKNTGTTGAISLLLNLTQIPTPTGFVSALAGQTRNFQTWHRDSVGGVATSNFTNSLAVTFQ
jgi:hypothetical protein